jgi:hypothetical protein
VFGVCWWAGEAAWLWGGGGPPPGRWFGVTLLQFLALSMGLALHNARAVVQGWLRRASPFVRTPKLGTGVKGRGAAYRAGPAAPRPLAQSGLTLYFAVGLAADFYYHSYGLLPFHVLLVAGFGTLTGYAWHEWRGLGSHRRASYVITP